MSDEKNNVAIRDFEDFLRKSYKSANLELVDFRAVKFLPLGENFGSVMAKITATIRKNGVKEKLHYVAKTMFPSEKPMVDWTTVLRKEAYMYTDIIPAYQSLERDMCVKPIFDILPKYIGHRCPANEKDDSVSKEDSMLVLENLKARGYYTCDWLKGMDFEHAKKALLALAEFHALGIAVRQKKPELFEKIANQARRPIGVNFEIYDRSFDRTLQVFRENSCFARNLSKIVSTFDDVKNGRVYVWRSKEPWLTLIHGDFWIANILFHKDVNDLRVDSVKFVDFQIYVLNSPARDLPHFFYGGNVNDEVKNCRVDELLNCYHETFVYWLERLGCDSKSFSRDEFDRELKKQAIDVFPLIAIFIRFGIYDMKPEQSESDLLFDILQCRGNDAYVLKLRKLVEAYEERGWF